MIPITLHEIGGDGTVPENAENVEFVSLEAVAPEFLFEQRVAGYRSGTQEYVSHCDPGDIILPSAFEAFEPYIGEYDAICSNSVGVGQYGQSSLCREWGIQYSIDRHAARATLVHQLFVVRRSVMEAAIEEVSNWPREVVVVTPNGAINAAVAKISGWHFIDSIGYVWFDTQDSFHARASFEQRRFAENFIKSYLQG